MKFVFKPITFVWKRFWKLRRRNKVFAIIGLLIVLGILNSIFNKKNPADSYQLEAAKIDSITEIVSETGNVTTAGVTPIYSTTTGMVEEVFIQNGDPVTKDQLLFKVRATATKQEQSAARATYLAAKSALETAKSTELSLQATMFSKWDAFKELAEGDDYEDADGNPRYDQRGQAEFHIPEKEWLAAEAAYKKQQVAISQASAHLSATWQAYQATQDSEVKANFEGEVRNLGVSKGDLVTISSPTSAVSPALVLVDDTIRPIIKLNINETEALKVQEGQKAIVEFDAISGETFEATVDRVDTVAAPSTDVVTFSVYVVIDERSDQIRSGLTSDVDITVSNKESVLTVPSSSVKPYQGGKAVRVVGENSEIEFIQVEVGSKGNGRTEIVSGIEEGREVIVSLANDQVERSGGLF